MIYENFKRCRKLKVVLSISFVSHESMKRGDSLGIGIGEVLVILLIAFFVVGPEDLPKIARTLAIWVKKIRNTMKDLTASFENEISLEETKKNFSNVTSEVEKAQAEVLRQAAEQNNFMQSKMEDLTKNAKT